MNDSRRLFPALRRRTYPSRQQTDQPNAPQTLKTVLFQVQGIHCARCVLLIERKLKQLAGVQKVRVDAATGKVELLCAHTPPLQDVQQAVQADGYTILPWQGQPRAVQRNTARDYTEIAGIALLLIGLYQIFSRLQLIPTTIGVSQNMSYAVVFVIGLVASVSSCMAATEGVVVGMVAAYSERQGAVSRLQKMQPSFLFNIGRIVSYTTFGALIGALGTVFTLSSQLNGVVIVAASLVMVLLGFQLLKLFPWVRRFQPKMPTFLAHKMYDASDKPSNITSFLVGAGTFFLPCGFTQALQFYVLSKGDAVTGAWTMLAFSLGTLPALLSVGALLGLVTGRVQRSFLKVSGVFVLLLGLVGIGNGLAVADVPIPSLVGPTSFNARSSQTHPSPAVPIIDGKQVVSMKVVGFTYIPSTFTVVQGVPVEWHVDGNQADQCARILTVPALGLTIPLPAQGSKTIVFLPKEVGSLRFSCPAAMTTPGARFLVIA